MKASMKKIKPIIAVAQGDFVHKYQTLIRPALLADDISRAVSAMDGVFIRFSQVNQPELIEDFPNGSYDSYRQAIELFRAYRKISASERVKLSGNLVRLVDGHVMGVQLAMRGNEDYESARKSAI